VNERSREIDFDAFGPPTAPAATDGHSATGGNLDPVEAARRHHEQEFEALPHIAKNVTPIPKPLAVIWPTRTGGDGHICAIVGWNAEEPLLRCTCEAAVKGNTECWAMAATRRMVRGA
jgi:hypothetical protein